MKICFVTNELFPVASGGIGRMLHDFCVDNFTSKRGHEIFLLVVDTKEKSKQVRISSYFEDSQLAKVRFVGAICNENRQKKLGNIWEESNTGFSRTGFVAKSQVILSDILDWEEELEFEFDFVEFPDMEGWSYASIGARRSGLAFQDTRIVVRLHSTLGMIYANEPYWHDNSDSLTDLYEIERQCLKDADIVVGHLKSVVLANQSFYGFSESWLAKTIIEFPPIAVRERSFGYESEFGESLDTTDFIFSGRLQPVKKPDLFITAAAQFIQRNPSHRGRFFLAAYGWDNRYINWLKSLIPLNLINRIVFLRSPTSGLRDYLQFQGIVVIPSLYESLCLSAYENSLAGTQVILNESCVAFSNDSPWVDGVNCTKFDGSVLSLANAFELALRRKSEKTITSVLAPAFEPYWNSNLELMSSSNIQNTVGRLVVVLIVGSDTVGLSKALSKLESCLKNPNIKVLIVADPEIVGAGFIGDFECHMLVQIGARPIQQAIFHAVSRLEADYVAVIEVSENLTSGEFLVSAQKALDNNFDLDIVACHALNISDSSSDVWQYGDRDHDKSQGQIKVSLGSRWFSSTTESSVVGSGVVWRTGRLVEDQFDENCPRDVLGVALSSAIADGANTIVIPVIGVKTFNKLDQFPPDEWLFASQRLHGTDS